MANRAQVFFGCVLGSDFARQKAMEARREAPLSLAATEVFGRLTQEQLNSHHTRPRDLDPALQLNPSACQADFTYTMVLDVVKI